MLFMRAISKRPGVIVLLLVLLTLTSGPALAQGSGATDEITVLTKNQQGIILDSLYMALDSIYVYPEKAAETIKALKKNFKDGKYNDLTEPNAFTQKISDDMYEICHDGHLGLRYVPGLEPLDAESNEPTDEELAEQLLERKFANFGFEKLERLPGNIGYLKFNGFSSAGCAGGTAIAAMNWLANSEALIIDLRDNGGGSPSMVQLISSYFFDDVEHLNTFYIRNTDSYEQYYTQAYVIGPRLSDIPIYILTSRYTFSAAEEFTYNLKNMKRAVIVGETTGGGAHPLDDIRIASFDIQLRVPFGKAINPISETNWEGTGVVPDYEIAADSALEFAQILALDTLVKTVTEPHKSEIFKWIRDYKKALQKPFELNPDLARKYIGDYDPRKIFMEDGQLYYQRGENPKYKMTPMSEDTFVFEDLDYFRLKIETDENGNPVAAAGIYQGGRTDRCERTDKR